MIEMLHKLLRYNATSGKLYWRRRSIDMFVSEAHGKTWNTKWAGKEALASVSHGYKQGDIFCKSYSAHSVIWALHYNFWADEIDHWNGDTLDNRLGNLRNVSHTLNGRNTKRYKNNTSGVAGVVWDSGRQRWRAQIMLDYKTVNLGRFVRKADAIAARKAVAAKHGFTKRHGIEL